MARRSAAAREQSVDYTAAAPCALAPDDKHLVRGPMDICALVADLLDKPQEHFVVLALNTRGRLIKRIDVSVGTLASVYVHPRDVFRGLIAVNAASGVAVHNHPSGDPTPSEEDVKITHQLQAAGEILGIPVLDHIIVAERGIYSFMSQSRDWKRG